MGLSPQKAAIMRDMRVLVAPDKLKGCLTASGAARAMAQGVERAGGATTEVLALADGGDGTLDALVGALGGELRSATVTDAAGAPVVARFGLLDDGRTALVESAEAIGLARLPRGRRQVLDTTSFGVGELVLAALDAGPDRILVALGGSATNDGGVGAAQALGARLEGVPIPARARDLPALCSIDRSSLDPRLSGVELIALYDVLCPLSGPAGASRMFGPQKGATPDEVLMLEAALAHLASHFAQVDTSLPGMGAAGGLGFGLVAFTRARLVRGADYVLDRLDFEARARACDLVLTAEGCLDAQTLAGKLVACVGERAARLGIPAIAIAGRISVDLASLAEHGLVSAFPLADGPMAEAESMDRAAELLSVAAERVVRAFRSSPLHG